MLKHSILILVGVFGSYLSKTDPSNDISKPLLIVTTDIGQDPDDLQSLIRLLHYADQFEIIGLIANADNNQAGEVAHLQDTLIDQCLDAYEQIEENLRLHSPSYPTAQYLRSVVKKGCSLNGVNVPIEKYIGEGKDTEGSDRIIRAVAKARRPVAVSVWGGGADLAQALWKIKNNFSEDQLGLFVAKLRVYFIGQQDSSVQWILKTFPHLWAIVSDHPEGDKWQSVYRGMFSGGDMDNTSKEWLKRYVLDQNPLSSMYPNATFTGGEKHNPHMAMKEGDTPSWFFFLENGLNDSENPNHGGWGGRFEEIKPLLFSDSQDFLYDIEHDSIMPSARGTVYRWRKDFQNDFAARIQWGKLLYDDANHPPEIKIASHVFDHISEIECRAGNSVSIDASPTIDPDGDDIEFEWFFYQEASTFPFCDQLITEVTPDGKIEIILPQTARGKNIHLILRVEDSGIPPLVAYRRIVLSVI